MKCPALYGYGIHGDNIMLNSEQKTRLDQLLAIESLKTEEAEELKTLQDLEPADPAADEFDAEWDELDGKKPALKADADKEKTLVQIEKEQDAQLEKDKDESQSTDADNTDGDLINTTPADSDKTLDSTVDKDAPDTRDKEIADLTQKMSSWDGRIKAAEKRAVAAEQKLKDMEKGKDKNKDSENVSPDEDDVELGKFFKEYPDLEAPIKKVAEKMATKIFDAKIGNKIETLEETQATAQVTAEEKADADHMAVINAAHPDWSKIYDSGALHTWIKRQPGYLQPRLTEILKKGSAQEVVDMFDSYKRAAGKGKETTTNSASPDKVEKAKVIEAVPASSGGPKEGKPEITKDDFDGAWDDLEEKEKQKQK